MSCETPARAGCCAQPTERHGIGDTRFVSTRVGCSSAGTQSNCGSVHSRYCFAAGTGVRGVAGLIAWLRLAQPAANARVMQARRASVMCGRIAHNAAGVQAYLSIVIPSGFAQALSSAV